jgi:hypothetical protein
MAFRRKVFNDVKGFWEYPPYGADDLDFCMKALFLKSLPHSYLFYSILNSEIYLKKHIEFKRTLINNTFNPICDYCPD